MGVETHKKIPFHLLGGGGGVMLIGNGRDTTSGTELHTTFLYSRIFFGDMKI